MRCGKPVSRSVKRADRTNCFKSSFINEGGFFYYGQIYLKYKVGLLKYIEEINKRRCVIIEEVTFYKIQSNTLADLSDAVRNLNEDDYNRNPASMTANINDISTALRTSINEQNILVEALKKALQYKTASAAGQLPTLTNPGVASDLIEGKQLIDQSGLIVTGTLQPQAQVEDLTAELTEQDRLIAALEEMIAYKASVNESIETARKSLYEA